MNIEILKDKKKELNLSNVELSQKSGVPLGTLSKIMAGIITNPKLSTLQAITSALGCTIDDLYYDRLPIKLSSEEKEIIIRYRENPQMHSAVKKLLGLCD